MKKIKIASFLAVFIFLIMFLTNVKANDGDMITITKNSTNGTIEFMDNGNPNQIRKGDQLRFRVIPNSGYRLVNITASDGSPISITEDGNTNQNPIITFTPYMQNFILQTNNNTNNITLTVTYEEVESFDIRYATIPEDAESVENLTFHDYLTGYQDGDIILPEECSNGINDCALEFKTTKTAYDDLKAKNDAHNATIFEQDRHSEFFVDTRNSRVGDDEFPEDTIESECDRNNLECDNSIYSRTDGTYSYRYIKVNKRYNEIAVTTLTIGERQVHIYSDNYIGFDVSTNIQNFNDTLFESNSEKLSFTRGNDYKRNAEIFYGTSNLSLSTINAKELKITSGTMNTLKNNVETMTKNSGNYNIQWDATNKVGNVTFTNTYDMNVLLDLKLSNSSGWNQNVKIDISKFAFAGNAGQLNGFNREYWTTQYRGVTDVFYSGARGETLYDKNICEIMKNNNGEIGHNENIRNIDVIERNTNFKPYAQAIFYDAEDKIVGTKSFDLNSLVKLEGYTNIKYNNIDADLFYYGYGIEKPVNDIRYFNADRYQDIMYDINLIKKTDAENLGVKRIALFLTNGPLENDVDLPKLAYGVGEGRNFIIPSEEGEER